MVSRLRPSERATLVALSRVEDGSSLIELCDTVPLRQQPHVQEALNSLFKKGLVGMEGERVRYPWRPSEVTWVISARGEERLKN